MSVRPLVSPEDQTVTFVELFFDLVFVFSVTQVVGLLHDGITWVSIGQAILVFWMVWWAWTQFTWALNAADTTHPRIEFATLLATAIAFFMAVTLPGAFHGHALWFAVPYLLVRSVGLTVYFWVSSADAAMQAAVRYFALLSLGGGAAILIGAFLPGTAQAILWAAAIVLDFIAAWFAGRSEGWGLHVGHFTERHGLFVIIALGESLIVAASGVVGSSLTPALLVIGLLSVAVVCGLWWSYFDKAKDHLEHLLASRDGVSSSMLARDAYSFLHFPMVLGIIANAVAIEEIVAHPLEPLDLPGRIMIAAGLLLFVGGMGLALWLAEKKVQWPRMLVTVVTGAVIIALGGVPPAFTLAAALAGLVIVAAAERTLQTQRTENSPS